MKEGIKIELEKLQSFEASQMQQDEPALGAAETVQQEERRTAALEGLEKTAAWAVEAIQKSADRSGLPGISKDEEFRKDYTALGMICIEEMADDEFLKKSPQYAFGILTAGILVQNGMALSKAKKKKDEQE
ncbi:MAG TPA: hypothetical protein VFG39_01465 [Balneolaceae bacterium]|nr:hypothetical protein [Balneolaceae bacterium]